MKQYAEPDTRANKESLLSSIEGLVDINAREGYAHLKEAVRYGYKDPVDVIVNRAEFDASKHDIATLLRMAIDGGQDKVFELLFSKIDYTPNIEFINALYARNNDLQQHTGSQQIGSFLSDYMIAGIGQEYEQHPYDAVTMSGQEFDGFVS